MDITKSWYMFNDKLGETKFGITNLQDVLTKFALFMLLLLVIPYIFSTERTALHTDMKIGSIATKKVVAPFNFFILKTEDELKNERTVSRSRVPFYFEYSDSVTANNIDRLKKILPFILENKPQTTSGDSAEFIWNSRLTVLQEELQNRFNFQISIANLNILYDLLSNKEYISELKKISIFLAKYIKAGIINLHISQITRPNVVIVRHGVEETGDRENLVDIPTVQSIMEESLGKSFNQNQITILNYYLYQTIQPNLIYDAAYTQQVVEKALASVSLTKEMVYENERIVDANERINEEIYQKLYSLEMAQVERSRREGNWQERIAYLGKIMLLAAILFIFGLYLFSYRKKIFWDNKKLFMIIIILMTECISAALITGPLNWPVYLIPTTIASMLLAILIDSGIAFVGTVVIALILGGIQGSGYDIALITMVSGMAGIYSVHLIRNRNQVFKAILYIAVAYFWVIIALNAMRFGSMVEAMRIFGINLLPNAVLSSFITFMILGLFEKFFDITTDVTLLELSDLNHPLLKRLSMEAPGTFHHSMIVGNLAESAAKAIKANSLLARVGSYYHDIGKIEKPEYFVENQMDAENRHNMLAPSMSALILASHVKNGIDLAKKHGIPKLIRDFIPEHHGTNIMGYFYNKARKNGGDKEIHESDFRYPGPKPQSKETGIAMLADAVEAATRTINNPNPNKVRAFIEDIVDKRFREGELDECDLTLRDLKNIIDAFMPVLSGVFQHRVEYPDDEKKKPFERQRSKSDKKK